MCVHGGVHVDWSGISDDDCAFMFLSEEDAYAEGGTALAEAWLEVANLAYERLMPAAVAVAEGPPVGRVLPLNPKEGAAGSSLRCVRIIQLKSCDTWRSWLGR